MKHRRILLLFVATFLLLATTTYVVLTSTGATSGFVRQLLARTIRADLQVGSAEVDPTTGKLRISGLQIRPRQPGSAAELRAGDVILDVATNPLGTIGAVRSVLVRDLDLQLDLTQGAPTSLRELLGLEAAQPGSKVEEIPAITITDSRLSIRVLAGAQPVRFEQLELTLLREEGRSSRYVLAGSGRSPEGFLVTLSGIADLARGTFRVLADIRDLVLSSRLLHPYSAEAEAWLQRAELSGRGRRLSLWFEYPAGDSSETRNFAAGASLEFDSVSLRAPQIDYALSGLEGRAFLTTRDGGVLKFELQRPGTQDALLARGTLREMLGGQPQTELELRGTDLAVDERVTAAVRSIPAARRVWDAFAPRGGRADLDLRLRNEQAGAPLRAALDLSVRGVSASFESLPGADPGSGVRFPYRFDELQGLIQVRPGGTVAVHGLRGRRADGGELELNVSREPDSALTVDVRGRNLQFGTELRDALAALLPEDGARHYDEFAPRGRSDVHVRVTTEPEQPAQFRVELQPRSASVCWEGFPCRVEDLRGSIRIENAGVSFRVDASRRDASSEAPVGLALDGRFLTSPVAGRMRSELWLRLDPLTLDPELERCLRALAPSLGLVLDELQPSGRTGAELALWRAPEQQEFRFDLRLDLSGTNLLPAAIGLPVVGLHGPLFVHGGGDRVDVRAGIVRGTLPNAGEQPPATLLVQGSQNVEFDGDGNGEPRLRPDLHFVLRGLALDDQLAAALDAQQIFRQRTWDVLQPSGTVDLVLRRHADADGTKHDRLRIFLRNVSSTAEMLPGAATQLTGELIVEDRQVRFEEIRGLHDGQPVVVTGGAILPIEGGTALEFTVSAQRVAVNEKLGRLMNAPLRRAYLERNATGAVAVDGCWIRIEMFDEPESFRTEFRGNFVALDVALDLVVRVRQINGPFRVARGYTDADGGRVEFSTEGLAFDVIGHRVSDFAMLGVADPEQLLCSTIEGRVHSGRIRQRSAEPGNTDAPPPLRYRYDGEGELAVLLDFEGISLSEFLRAATTAPTQLRGTVNGHVQLDRLVGTNLVDIVANGALQVRDGQLGIVPIFTQLFSVLDPELRPRFDGLQFRARIADRSIELRGLELTSPVLTVRGEGSIDMDGYTDMVLEFPNLFGQTGDLLVLPRILTFLSGQIVRFHVYGHLRHLYARSRAFWQDDPGRRGFEPLPVLQPTVPRRPRF